jgi:hypothetical protein
MSNTESASTQWKEIAETLGFPDEPTMWVQLYQVEGRPIAELSKTLGFGTATLARRIALCGVEKRPRGGVNNPSKLVTALKHLDQRFVRTAQASEIASLVGCSTHSIYRILKEI